MQPGKSMVNMSDKMVKACQAVSQWMVKVLFDKDTWWGLVSEKLSAVHPRPRFSCCRMARSDCEDGGIMAGSRGSWVVNGVYG